MWRESFENLYSIHSNDGFMDFEDFNSDSLHIIKCIDVSNAIKHLKCHKACGPDGIQSEAIKYGGHLLSVHLTLLFNMCISHCYLPKGLIINDFNFAINQE